MVAEPPTTYVVDNVQYVRSPGTDYTFVLGGKAPPPALSITRGLARRLRYSPKDVPDGTAIYVAAYATCHGVLGVDKGSNVRNLGYVSRDE